MTGKAARRVAEVTGQPAQTLHSKFYWPPGEDKRRKLVFERVRDPEGGLYIVDEASMMSPSLFEKLQRSWVEIHGAKILLIGDGFQLPPVLAKEEERRYGTDFSVFAKVKTLQLKTVMRSGDDILDAATQIRERGLFPRASRGVYTYIEGSIYNYAVGTYLKNPNICLITWRNEVRMTANGLIRRQLGHDDPHPLPGEPVLVCKNGYGRMNGEIVVAGSHKLLGRAGPIEVYDFAPAPSRVLVSYSPPSSFLATFGTMDGSIPYLDNAAWRRHRAELRRNDWGDPLPLTWGYTLTAHKAQGSEYDDVMVFLSGRDGSMPGMSKSSILPDGSRVPFWRRFLYTAATRAKKTLTIVTGTEELA